MTASDPASCGSPRLSALLCEFWAWLRMTPEAYAQACGEDLEEYMFPQWEPLLRAAAQAVLCSPAEAHRLDEALVVLALDHEREELLDELDAAAPDASVLALAERARRCPQPNARWQIAELLGRRRLSAARKILAALQQDPDPYVRKRAENAAERWGSEPPRS